MAFHPKLSERCNLEAGNRGILVRLGFDEPLLRTLTIPALIFLLSYLILFLGMSLRPNFFDEGIVLTAAMRVVAGQVPHRDFYTLYGPAQFYLLSALFRVFGESILVERLLDLAVRALVVTSMFRIASFHCRKSVATCTSIVAVLWLFGLNEGNPGTAVIPLSLLNLMSTELILPVFWRGVSRQRMLVAGAIAGIATMFRYDCGIALLAVHACTVIIAASLGNPSVPKRLGAFASAFWPYLFGFVVVILPPAVYYFSVAPLYPFIHDFILYPLKYYHRGRNLPYPAIRMFSIDELADYLPIAIVGVSFLVVLTHRIRGGMKAESRNEVDFSERKREGFLIAFGLLALVMYFKGFVRISPVQLYLCTIPSLLLVAVLFQRRLAFPFMLRIAVIGIVWFSILAAGFSCLYRVMMERNQHSSVLESLVLSARQTTPKGKLAWCKVDNALTRGFCFVPDNDRLQTIEFIDDHTRPDQPLFVGLRKHDKIYANDCITYFAAQRLPATRWSEFDPDLQNREDIQRQMIQELEASAPPYVVLDSEFESSHEPNDSSISSGVTLLDEYLRGRYRQVESFGPMSIWQLKPAP